MRLYVLVTCLVMSLGSTICSGQSLQKTLDDIDVGNLWKYNDWEAAKAKAVKSRKPILALFR